MKALPLMLLLAGCTSAAPYPRSPFDLPPCAGTWLCDKDKGWCECVHRKAMGEWWRRNAP